MITASGKIQFSAEGRLFNLAFERFHLSDQIERIRVYGKTSKMELQSDRPFLRINNARKAVKWQIISDTKT